MLYSLYRCVTSASAPLLEQILKKRIENNKEDPARLSERRGQTHMPRPDGKLMWFHGASVGESLSILPLLNTLKARLPEWNFLVTTGTVTSADLMAQRLPDWAIHQFVPWDHPQWVRNFMDHWHPDAVVWLESELWPNIMHELRTRKIPSALINARMRPKSFSKWQYAKGLAEKMLGTFTFTLVGARDYLKYFKALGAKNVSYIGSLKLGARPLPVDETKLAALRAMIGNRPCIGFLQSHPTEEAFFADVFKKLKKDQPDLLAFVVPRKYTRGQEIKTELQEKGLNVAVRTMNDTITPQTDIYIGDTIGEMGLWYTLCPVAIVGGSFIYYGGQNPIEGVHFGTAVLYGPSMFNFPELCIVLEEAGAAKMVPSQEALLPALRDLYAHPEKREAMKQAALNLAEQNYAVIDSFADEIAIQLTGLQ